MRVVSAQHHQAAIQAELPKANIEFLQKAVHAHEAVVWPKEAKSSDTTWPWEEYPKCSWSACESMLRIQYTVSKNTFKRYQRTVHRRGQYDDAWWSDVTTQARILHEKMLVVLDRVKAASEQLPEPSVDDAPAAPVNQEQPEGAGVVGAHSADVPDKTGDADQQLPTPKRGLLKFFASKPFE